MAETSTKNVEEAVRELRLGGDIDDATFHKNLVNVAYDFLAVEQSVSEAARVLRSCDEAYFEAVLGEQMRADEEFRDVVYWVAVRLVEEGVVDLGPSFNFGNQKPAKA